MEEITHYEEELTRLESLLTQCTSSVDVNTCMALINANRKILELLNEKHMIINQLNKEYQYNQKELENTSKDVDKGICIGLKIAMDMIN